MATSNNTQTTTHVQITSDIPWKVTPEYSYTIPFSKIGRITLKESKNSNHMDLLDILGEVPKGSRDLFLEIKRAMSYKTNRATLPMHLSSSKINARSKYFKENT